MTEIKIKGTADFSSVTKEVKRLTGTIANVTGKDGISLFDKKSMAFLKTEATAALGKMQGQMRRLVDEAKKLDQALAASTGDQAKHNELLNKRYDNLKRIASLGKNIKKVGRAQQTMEGGPADAEVKELAKSGLAQIIQSIPRIGGITGLAVDTAKAAQQGAQGAAGSGAAGMLGMGAMLAGLTAVIGGTIIAFNKVSDSFDYFSAQVPGLLAKAALGLGENFSDRQARASRGMGFNPDQTIQTQLDSARAFGTMRSQRAQENLTINTQMAGRALGIDPGQISGTANQMRSTMGVRQAESATAQILSRAMTQGMDKSQATAFLSATAGLLTDINKNGLMSNDALIGAMASLTKNNMLSPEQAAKTLSGMQGAITGSTGEANAFFQRSFARAGIGNGSMFGSQFAVKQGLMGVNPAEFLQQTGGNKQGLEDLRGMGLVQDKGFLQKRAQGILGEAGAIGFDQKSREGRLQKAAFVGQQFGVQNIAESIRLVSILEKMAKGETLSQKETKMLKTLGQDPEAKWRDEALRALNTIAGSVARAKAGESFAKFELGKDAAGVMVKLIDANTMLLQGINALTIAMGGKGTAAQVGQQFLGGALDEARAKNKAMTPEEKAVKKQAILDAAKSRKEKGFFGSLFDDSPLEAGEKALKDFRAKKGTVTDAKESLPGAGDKDKDDTNKLLLEETKKTNRHLEKITNQNHAPKVKKKVLGGT